MTSFYRRLMSSQFRPGTSRRALSSALPGLRPAILLALVSTAVASGAPASTLVYSNDFTDDPGQEWSNPQVTISPNTQERFLGRFNNESVTLSLNGLPAHHALSVSFDLYLIESWDGSEFALGPDLWELRVPRERILLRSTFSNSNDPLLTQSYPDFYPHGRHPPLTGALQTNTLGFEEVAEDPGAPDSTHHLTFSFTHTNDQIVLHFSAADLEAPDNESWGLDNVVVSVEDPPGGIIELDTPVVYASEAAQQAVVTVWRRGATNQTATIDYQTLPGAALAGSDYNPASGTLTFAPGEAAHPLLVDLLDNGLQEGDREFAVQLSNASPGSLLGAPARADVVILDDDTPGPRFASIYTEPPALDGGSSFGAAWGGFRR